ncbi:MAG: hypothetical protein JKY22_07150 [Flavobacteriaceae bacterium]|nr:hypothetical protein [Flavobacteriaceae bacterium]
MGQGKVMALSKSEAHTFNKYNCEKIMLLKGLGVQGDAHMGKTVKHLSRVKKDPTTPNLRQVHLIHSELFEELSEKGFTVNPGEMGENITTSGVDLLNLPKGSILKIGISEIMITGLRNPCSQLESIQTGLMKALLDKDKQGEIVRKAGIMGIIQIGGEINTGDVITVQFPAKPYIKLDKV